VRVSNPWKSIRLKMSILAAIILGGILVLYSFYLFVQLQNVLNRNLDAELKVKALELAKTIKAFQNTRSPGGDIHYAAIKVLDFNIEQEEREDVELADRQWLRLVDRYDLDKDYIVILSLKGKVLASSKDIPPAVEERLTGIFVNQPMVKSTWESISYQDTDMRVLQMTILARDKPHYYIQIATPVVTVGEFLQGRLWGIAFSMLIVVILFSFVGLLLANQILRPVRKIAETAESITHEDLSSRVEISNVDIEMLFLVNAFNKMTERLESSFKHMAGMTANMAHELKTPLAVVKGEGQMALRRNRSEKEYRAVIESSIVETEKMLKVIDDLLIAANIAYDKEIFQIEPIDIELFLKDIYQKSQILAEPRDVRMELSLPNKKTIIKGDKVHLRRLFFNLIANAIEHSSRGQVVRIFVEVVGNRVVISVQDEGEGIDKEDLPRIFERTFRKKKKNRPKGKYQSASGMGLYLCRIIAEAHRGEIRVKSELGKGSTFSLFLPLE
jgi:two-component system, OmpR family, heavy metal sensor histidine kinase CusS